MRVSDRSTIRNYLKYLNKAQQDYLDTNQRVSSGCRFTELSDDVSAGTRVLRTRTDKYKAEKQYDNVKSIGDQLSVEESAMTSINDLLGTIHGTKIVKAMQESTGDAGRQTIAAELDGMLESLVQFANTKYDQNFVFGGSNAFSAPFTVNSSGKLCYNGVDVDNIKKDTDGTYYYVDPSEAGYDPSNPTKHAIPMNDETYMDIGLGIRMDKNAVKDNSGFKISYNGVELLGFGKDENGQSNNLYNIIAGIRDNIKNYDKAALEKLDTKLVKRTDEFRENLTSIGTKTSFLDTMETRLKANVDSYKLRISDLMGTNDAEEATNLTSCQYVLKAVLQMGSQLLPVSLMDYLK
jgi:flagellar hook-associated protein 3 FlgL